MTRNHSLKDPPLGLVYFVVVDRGITAPHQAALVELPQFIPMRSPPLSLCIVALVLEPDRDAVISEAPEVLLEPVVKLPCPLAPQERDDLLATLEELITVTPLGVLCVGERHLLGVARVPRVLGHLHLLPRGLFVEWRQRRSYLLFLAALLHEWILLLARMLTKHDS